MSDAWIYSTDGELVGTLSRSLAELGYSPRQVTANGSLMPAGARQPELVVVAAGASEPAPGELVARLRENESLCRVALVAAVDRAHLASAADLAAAEELLVHPFCGEEVGLRVTRARRRAHGVLEDDILRSGSLALNLATYQVTIAGELVGLTFTEHALLRFFMSHPNRAFSREALLSAVWGYDYYGGARTVDVHVRRVRAKVGPEHEARIRTVRSVGYLFEQ